MPDNCIRLMAIKKKTLREAIPSQIQTIRDNIGQGTASRLGLQYRYLPVLEDGVITVDANEVPLKRITNCAFIVATGTNSTNMPVSLGVLLNVNRVTGTGEIMVTQINFGGGSTHIRTGLISADRETKDFQDWKKLY